VAPDHFRDNLCGSCQVRPVPHQLATKTGGRRGQEKAIQTRVRGRDEFLAPSLLSAGKWAKRDPHEVHHHFFFLVLGHAHKQQGRTRAGLSYS
jgi:hypothetical protein